MSEEKWLRSADLEEMLRLLGGKLPSRKIRILMWLYVGWFLTETEDPASNKLADDLEEHAEGIITGRVLARRFMKSKSEDLAAFGHPWSFDGSREPSIRELECGTLWVLLLFLPIGTVTLGDSRVWQTAREAEPTAFVRKVMRGMVAVLRDVAGNPFRPVSFDPAWRTSTVVALAQQTTAATSPRCRSSAMPCRTPGASTRTSSTIAAPPGRTSAAAGSSIWCWARSDNRGWLDRGPRAAGIRSDAGRGVREEVLGGGIAIAVRGFAMEEGQSHE